MPNIIRVPRDGWHLSSPMVQKEAIKICSYEISWRAITICSMPFLPSFWSRARSYSIAVQISPAFWWLELLSRAEATRYILYWRSGRTIDMPLSGVTPSTNDKCCPMDTPAPGGTNHWRSLSWPWSKIWLEISCNILHYLTAAYYILGATLKAHLRNHCSVLCWTAGYIILAR
jgi:hypothetical protein